MVIAEIGVNHDGSVDLAKELIDRAVEAGADGVKFQMRALAELYTNGGDPDDPREDLATQYALDVQSRAHLDRAAMFDLFDYAVRRGVMCLCTPWDHSSLAAVVEYDLPGLKVASADLTNHDLLHAMARTGKPLLVSTGMSRQEEIRQAVALLRQCEAQFALLHCVSAYPPPFKDIHLRYLEELRTIGGGCPVGYSSHERGWAVVLAAVALGAQVIEKHFTLDRTRAGVDHKVSLLPREFREMMQAIREVEAALGSTGERHLRHGERINRQVLAKSLVARRPVPVGEVITRDVVAARSPGRGIQPNRLPELIGRCARRSLAEGEPFFETDLAAPIAVPRAYRFRRPWGLPVRFHDFADLSRRARPDFVEFHLSYKDLDQSPDRFLAATYTFGFTVHSPDQFAGDIALDLATWDEDARQRAIRELQRVVDLARTLTRYFPGTPRPLVIASLGGFSSDERLPVARRRALYERVAAGLAQIDTKGVEVLPQTLPPFPWHYGGQRFGNLFVEADDTAWFCERFDYRLCFDVAHTYMAALHYGSSLEAYCERLMPLVAHLHLGDAAGVDGEGLQIGEGGIDFRRLAGWCEQLAPSVGFVPEIWEGHWNGGAGFWHALERLETWFGGGEKAPRQSVTMCRTSTIRGRTDSDAVGDLVDYP